MVTSSPALDLLSIALREAIATASQRGSKAKTYVPAVRESVRLARRIFREFEAAQSREDWKRSLEAFRQRPANTPVWNEQAAWDQQSRNPYNRHDFGN